MNKNQRNRVKHLYNDGVSLEACIHSILAMEIKQVLHNPPLTETEWTNSKNKFLASSSREIKIFLTSIKESE